LAPGRFAPDGHAQSDDKEPLMFISQAWAQDAAAGGGGGDIMMSLAPMVLIFVVFYFLLIRPQQRKMKEHKAMLQAVKRGDKILTTGGVFGQVALVGDDHLMIDVADGVQLRMSRDAVSAVLNRAPEAAKKPAVEKKSANDR
jgi:preprotein translocase subunit YajC